MDDETRLRYFDWVNKFLKESDAKLELEIKAEAERVGLNFNDLVRMGYCIVVYSDGSRKFDIRVR